MADADAGAVARYRDNLQGEIDGATLYRTLAGVEPDPHVAEVYRRLAAVEDAHAELWRRRLAQAGQSAGPARAGWRTRALAFVARHFGADAVLPVVNTLEQVDSAQYDRQPEAVAEGLPKDERSHARILKALTRGLPGLSGPEIGRIEGRQGGSGNTLRAAVLGANDGLVSNLSLVAGVAGANPDTHMLLITGLAGMLAGACSMAMGEWLSVTTSREMQQSQIASEAEELAQAPEEEKEELVLIYQSKGLDEAQAKALADKLMASRDTALDTLAREELGIDPKELGGSPWAAAGSSFFLFILGSLCPVLGLVFATGTTALWLSLLFSVAGLFLIGACTSIFTGRHLLFSGLRQCAIGLAAAAFTFGLGRLIGVSLGG